MSPQPFTVVVADDIPLMRLMLSKYVGSAGRTILEPIFGPLDIRVLEASNGEEAGALLQKHSVRLMFLDLMMPVKDGLTLIQEIRADRAHDDVKVVICSAVGDKDVVARALSIGAEAYVVKPFTLRAVRGKLEEIYSPSMQP